MNTVAITRVRRTAPHARVRAAFVYGIAWILFSLVGYSRAGAAPADAPAPPAFDILELRVLGNSVLEQRDIERVVYPHLGPNRTLADVEAARAELEKLYHDRGYGTVFVDIPEQEVADGIVRLHVLEGRLDRSTVSGARYFSDRKIRAGVPEAQAGKVPNLPLLQAQIATLNAQSEDRSVVPVLKAGAAPGTVDLALKVDDHLPAHAAVEFNNQATPDTSALRTSLTLSYADLFGRLDNLSLQYQTAPRDTKNVGVFALTYSSLVSDNGARLTFLFVDSRSDVSTVGALAVLGRGQIYGLRLIEPLGIAAGATHAFTAGIDYKHFNQAVEVNPTTSLTTPIDYVNFSAAYAGGARSDTQTLVTGLTANFGIRQLVNDVDTFENKRFLARPNYFYVRGNADWSVGLPHGFSVLTRAYGQYSVEPIIGNEQYAIAGADGVRGYLEAEQLGDIGIKGTLQLGLPPLRLGTAAEFDTFGFYDYGRAELLQPLSGEVPTVSLRSAGAGVSVRLWKDVQGTVTWAVPLVAGPRTAAHDDRILFVVRGTW